MRHISPTEMISRVESTPVNRVLFKRPLSGSGIVVEILAKNGEEIMISLQGTPDPVIFSAESVMAFFQELGFLSGSYDDVILDMQQYRPAGFEFARGKREISFAEVRNREVTGDYVSDLEEEPEQSDSPQASDPYAANEPFLQDRVGKETAVDETLEVLQEEEQAPPTPRLGEKYLTTINLIRLTSLWVVLEMVMILVMPSMVPAVKEMIYICIGSMIILAVSFVLFERRNPDHPSLRIRRYLWLCLLIFNISMVLSYLFSGQMLQ